MSQSFFENYTKTRLVSILEKLKDGSVKKSWSKPKLVSRLAEYTNKDILAVFTSDELKEGLEILEASASGNKKARYNRLLELIGGQTPTSNSINTTSSSSSKKSITLEGFEIPLTAKVDLLWYGPYLSIRAWGDYRDNYVDLHGDQMRQIVKTWYQAGGSHSYWEDYDDVDEWFSPYDFVRDDIFDPGSKDHDYTANLEASWSSIKEMLSNMAPSGLGYADRMRITMGKHAVLELTRFHIPDSYFGKKD